MPSPLAASQGVAAHFLVLASTICPRGQAVRTKHIVLKWAEECPIEHLKYSIRISTVEYDDDISFYVKN